MEGERGKKERKKEEDRARWTRFSADQLLDDMQESVSDLEVFLEGAISIPDHVSQQRLGIYDRCKSWPWIPLQHKDLLTLKQQQAAETLKQGQSTMLFTIITIIFVRASSVK